jgi:hypothetical protein
MQTRCKCGKIASTWHPCKHCKRVMPMRHTHIVDPGESDELINHTHPHDGKAHDHPFHRSYIILPCGHSQPCIYRETKLLSREVVMCRTCGETDNVRPEDQPDYVYQTTGSS